MNRALVVAGLLVATPFITAGSCATTRQAPEPIVKVVEVKIPVPVACGKRPGAAPAYPDTDAALAGAVDLFEQVKLLLAGRGLRIAEERSLRAGYEGCPP